MYKIAASVWRHIFPNVYNLTYEYPSSSTYTTLVIPRDLRIQGANPVSLGIINKYQVQGAFLCDFDNVTTPTSGRIEKVATGWCYVPDAGTSGTDTFVYRMIINQQPSTTATITINNIVT